jgi:hypothetical protein
LVTASRRLLGVLSSEQEMMPDDLKKARPPPLQLIVVLLASTVLSVVAYRWGVHTFHLPPAIVLNVGPLTGGAATAFLLSCRRTAPSPLLLIVSSVTVFLLVFIVSMFIALNVFGS